MQQRQQPTARIGSSFAILAVLAASFLVGATGCESFSAWMQQPLDPVIANRLDDAEAFEGTVTAKVVELEGYVAEIKAMPNATPEDIAMLLKLEGALDEVVPLVDFAREVREGVQAELGDSPTNADALLSAGAEIAAWAGLPGMAVLGLRLLREAGKTKAANARGDMAEGTLASVVGNFEKAKTGRSGDEFSINRERLRVLNMAAGVDGAVENIRGAANGKVA